MAPRLPGEPPASLPARPYAARATRRIAMKAPRQACGSVHRPRSAIHPTRRDLLLDVAPAVRYGTRTIPDGGRRMKSRSLAISLAILVLAALAPGARAQQPKPGGQIVHGSAQEPDRIWGPVTG